MQNESLQPTNRELGKNEMWVVRSERFNLSVGPYETKDAATSGMFKLMAFGSDWRVEKKARHIHKGHDGLQVWEGSL